MQLLPLLRWFWGLLLGRSYERICRVRSHTPGQWSVELDDPQLRGRLILSLHGVPRQAKSADAQLRLRAFRGHDCQVCLDSGGPAIAEGADIQVAVPLLASEFRVELEAAAETRGELVLHLRTESTRRQLSLVLQAFKRRMPLVLQNRLQQIWIRHVSRRKPYGNWGWNEITRLTALDRDLIARESDERKLPVSDIALLVFTGGYSGEEVASTKKSIQRQVARGMDCQFCANEDEVAERLRSLAAAPSEKWVIRIEAGSTLAPSASYWLARSIADAPCETKAIYFDEHIDGAWPSQNGMALYGDPDPESMRETMDLPGAVLVRARAAAGRLSESRNAGWFALVHTVFSPEYISQLAHIDEVLLSRQSHASTKRRIESSIAVPNGWNRVSGPEGNRLLPELPQELPDVAIVIPTRDRLDLLERCVESLRNVTRYPALEICVADNDSVEPETKSYFALMRSRGESVVHCPGAFNFSAIVNRAVANTRSDYVLLLNNDIEIIDPDWLHEMVAHVLRAEIGCVGAKLFYPDGRVQHAGVTIGLGNLAGHTMRFYPGDSPGYLNRLEMTQSYRAVTAACLLVRRDVYQEVGGFNETDLAVAYNDIDFCLRVEQAGYRNLWTPHARLVHHEYASRGLDTDAAKKARYARECDYFQKAWHSQLHVDPYYHRLLTRQDESCSLTASPSVRRPWMVMASEGTL